MPAQTAPKARATARRATRQPTRTTGARPEPALVTADRRTIGGRLTICREAKQPKLSKAAAAKLIGISPQAYGELERGESKSPSAETLLDMRDKLGFDPDYVIRGKGMPLLPNFEEVAKEMALLAIYRELRPEVRDTLINMAQGLRRAQDPRASPQDPYPFPPPPQDDNDDDD